MSKRVIISVTNDLRTDQRVDRICNALSELGFEILLIGRAPVKDYARMARPETAVQTRRLQMIFKKGFPFYAEFSIRLFWTLLVEKKNLLYANDLDTLLPNFLISRLSGTQLVYDSHEYFTEVPELVNRPNVKSFWQKLEASLFPRLKNVITVNEKLAEIYAEKYHVQVTAIRNVPELRTADELPGSGQEKVSKEILIYQGALNLGRGIELMIDCMAFLPEMELWIVGEGDLSSDLRNRVRKSGLSDRILFRGRLDPGELRKVTPQASLGLSLEEDLGLSYRYALPNKIFDYIHAGIPMIVSDLPVMGNLVRENGVGGILRERSPRELAKMTRQVLEKKGSYQKNLSDTARKFNWNREKEAFKKFIENLG